MKRVITTLLVLLSLVPQSGAAPKTSTVPSFYEETSNVAITDAGNGQEDVWFLPKSSVADNPFGDGIESFLSPDVTEDGDERAGNPNLSKLRLLKELYYGIPVPVRQYLIIPGVFYNILDHDGDGQKESNPPVRQTKRKPGILNRMPGFYGKRSVPNVSADPENAETNYVKREGSVADRMPAFFGKRSHFTQSVDNARSTDDTTILKRKTIDRMPIFWGKRGGHYLGNYSVPVDDKIGLLQKKSVADRMPAFFGKRSANVYDPEDHKELSLDKLKHFLNAADPSVTSRETAPLNDHEAIAIIDDNGLVYARPEYVKRLQDILNLH